MKWTEEKARLFFETTVWDGVPKPHNWRVAQVLIEALDTERERNARLEQENYMLLGASYKADLEAMRERNAKLERALETLAAPWEGEVYDSQTQGEAYAWGECAEIALAALAALDGTP